MLGTKWGQTPEQVAERFAGLRPIEENDGTVDYRLSAMADFLTEQGCFIPLSLYAEHDRDGNEIRFICDGGALNCIDVTFGYPFEILDEDPDRLSESGKHAVAKDVLQNIVAELAARYGMPLYVVESSARRGHTDMAGRAAFLTDNRTLVRFSVGHMGGYVTGRLRYFPPVDNEDGF